LPRAKREKEKGHPIFANRSLPKLITDKAQCREDVKMKKKKNRDKKKMMMMMT